MFALQDEVTVKVMRHAPRVERAEIARAAQAVGILMPTIAICGDACVSSRDGRQTEGSDALFMQGDDPRSDYAVATG